MKTESRYRVWYLDQEGCSQAIRAGKAVQADLTDYGGNDFVLEFLMGTGLWGVMTGMEPDGLKKGNGKPWRALNGVEVLRELAGVERVAHCGKIVRDTRLMRVAGFNAEAIRRAQARGQPVVDPETLANHLGRISPRSAARTFTAHVELMQRKRWIRGKVYVADAHEIIVPYGRTSERLGKVGEKYGYKLVILMNVASGRERVVGYVLAPLPKSERTLLRIILRGLAARLGPVQRWLEVLILDRGYWGAQYLLALHRRYGIEVVTRAQHDELSFVQDLDALVKDPQTDWQTRPETHSRLGDIQVRCAGVQAVPLLDAQGRLLGHLNGVVADEYDRAGRPLRDEQGQERPRLHYATTLPTAQHPHRTRSYYGQRWTIENQGFRELTQGWALDRLAGRQFNALNSRTAFVLMLYNADRVLRMKHPGPWQQERQTLRAWGEHGI